MKNQITILNLLNQKKSCQTALNNLVYGTIEIRANKYIYVHYREEGLLLTKYVGEYSDNLYNLILQNNIKAKELKSQIRKINKELQKLNYIEEELSPKIKINIDFARKNIVNTIYNQAILEGIATTYADTENIITGGTVNNMTSTDILKIINLKRAWEFILNPSVLLSPTDYNLLCTINKLVEEDFYYSAGELRNVPLSVGGTSWTPDLPIESVIKENLIEIFNSNQDIITASIEILLYIMKKQIFIDGNKRTAVIFANHYLIAHGAGMLIIPENLTEEFKKLLILYYENKDTAKIKKFLKTQCYISLN